jgi:deglycase
VDDHAAQLREAERAVRRAAAHAQSLLRDAERAADVAMLAQRAVSDADTAAQQVEQRLEAARRRQQMARERAEEALAEAAALRAAAAEAAEARRTANDELQWVRTQVAARPSGAAPLLEADLRAVPMTEAPATDPVITADAAIEADDSGPHAVPTRTDEGDTMSDELRDKTIAFLVANEGVEQVELTEPWRAMERAGGNPKLVAPRAGVVQAFFGLDRADTFRIDAVLGEIGPADFDGLVLPGGVANPDQLRILPDAVRFVREFVESGKPVGVISHGAWTLIEAGVVEGRTLTSWPSLRTDLSNAGANWVDEELHVDDNIYSSRKPEDVPAFTSAVISALARA